MDIEDLKIVSISYSFTIGGAGLAAGKFTSLIRAAFKNCEQIDQDDAGLWQFIKRVVSHVLAKLQFDSNPIKHSLNLFSYRPVLQSFKHDSSAVFHLHWINNDTLSVFQFNRIPAGSIITLHDEWLYCGAEHYYNVFDEQPSFVNGYQYAEPQVNGIHWNAIIWRIKLNRLGHRSDLIYTVPSAWLQERARNSVMLKNADIRLLPNPIDVERFAPCSKAAQSACRTKLKLGSSDLIILFGAVGGRASYLKGAHLLEEALLLLSTELESHEIRRIKLVDFGGGKESRSNLHGFHHISLGYISEQTELVGLYSTADVVVVPSLVESFGQVAAEALSCETPVICFNHSGLTDIVIDNETGLLARPYSSQSLAEKIRKCLLMSEADRKKLGVNGRNHIIRNFSPDVINRQLLSIVQDALRFKAGR